MNKKKPMNQSHTYIYDGVAYGYSNINWRSFNPSYEEGGVIFDKNDFFLIDKEEGREIPLSIRDDEYTEVYFTRENGNSFLNIRNWGEMEEPLEGCLPYRTLREISYPLFVGFKTRYRNPRHQEFKCIQKMHEKKLNGHILSVLP